MPGPGGEDMKDLMTAKIEKIARDVCIDEMARCPSGVGNEGKLTEHERRITDMESDLKDVPSRINNSATMIFDKLDDFRKQVVGYWIGTLGAIILQLVVIIVAILFAVTKLKAGG